MTLPELLEALRTEPDDRTLLGAVADAIGMELADGRTEHTATIVRALGRTPVTANAYATGYRSALEHVVEVVRSTRGRARRRDEIVARARREPYRSILLSFERSPVTAQELARQFRKHRTSVGRALDVLVELGLVEALDAGSDARLRPHALTPLGGEITDELRGDDGVVAEAVEGESDSNGAAEMAHRRQAEEERRAPGEMDLWVSRLRRRRPDLAGILLAVMQASLAEVPDAEVELTLEELSGPASMFAGGSSDDRIAQQRADDSGPVDEPAAAPAPAAAAPARARAMSRRR